MTDRVVTQTSPETPPGAEGLAAPGRPSPASAVDTDELSALESILGHRFRDRRLLCRALVHASHAEDRVQSNERLEFLGDAVLGMVACDMIFQMFPDMLEGEMTKIKSTAVSRRTCARLARDAGLTDHLVVGKGMLSGAALPQSLAAAVLESLIAAIYIDGGIEAARAFLEPQLRSVIERAAESGHQQNFKSVLQQHAQQTYGATPVYITLDEKGPDHAKCFQVCVEMGGQRFDAMWGQSKKQSEQLAALAALRAIGLIEPSGEDGEYRVVQNGDASGEEE